MGSHNIYYVKFNKTEELPKLTKPPILIWFTYSGQCYLCRTVDNTCRWLVSGVTHQIMRMACCNVTRLPKGNTLFLSGLI